MENLFWTIRMRNWSFCIHINASVLVALHPCWNSITRSVDILHIIPSEAELIFIRARKNVSEFSCRLGCKCKWVILHEYILLYVSRPFFILSYRIFKIFYVQYISCLTLKSWPIATFHSIKWIFWRERYWIKEISQTMICQKILGCQ